MTRIREELNKRVRLFAAWVWNRLNLARDMAYTRSFDFGPVEIYEVKELMNSYHKSYRNIQTINWIVPFAAHPLFAGVYTILRFADYLSREKGIENRLIFCLGQGDKLDLLRKKISVSFPSLAPSVHGLRDRGASMLPPSDVSIATSWDSAYVLLRAKNTAGKFYFVQDFEPLFYPAGTTYGLAEATYRMGFWGITNTRGLGEYLRQSYGMKLCSFEPAADPEVFYPAADRKREPLRIFFYGRPKNPRNGFLLGIEALKLVKRQFKERVQIVSAGGVWRPSAFGAEGAIENLGLLPSIRDVAALYRTCHIGLTFMFTKHPSYQPIEMMASGVAVVANQNSAMGLKNRENSLLAEPTVTCVADAISCLIREEGLRSELASEGLRAAQRTSWRAEMEGVYEFLNGRSADAPRTQVSGAAGYLEVRS